MRISKKFLFTALCILLVYSAYFVIYASSSKPLPQVLGTSTNLVLFEEPQDGRTPIINALQNAKKEILVEVYLLSDKEIIAALESAASRGVSVKVMLEEHPFGGGNNKKTYQELQHAQIAVEWTSSSYALTHEKAIVIDGSSVFILNQNLTTAAFSKNREYDIDDTNTEDVGEVRQIFIADWQRDAFTPHDANLVVSPMTSREKLTSFIESATKSIEIEIEDIQDPQVVALLSEKAKIMPVEIIVPTLSQMSSNKDALSTLQNAGAKIKIISSPYIHAKLIIVNDAKAYIGSVNLSTQSMDENRELGIIIAQSDIVSSLSHDFQLDFVR